MMNNEKPHLIATASNARQEAIEVNQPGLPRRFAPRNDGTHLT